MERGCVRTSRSDWDKVKTRRFGGCCGWSRTTQPRSGFLRRALSVSRCLWSVGSLFCARVGDVTRILDAAAKGDPRAADELLPLVYDELRRLAAAKMAQEQPGQTLQPTALVHEAWLRLVGPEEVRFSGRGHFFA